MIYKNLSWKYIGKKMKLKPFGVLGSICCKKRQKIVTDQLLVFGVGTSEEPEGFQTDSK